MVSKPLRELRLSIIGDNDEKLQLLRSSEDMDYLFSVLQHAIESEDMLGKDEQLELHQVLIILYSLTLYPMAINSPRLKTELLAKLANIAIRRHSEGDGTILSLVCQVMTNVMSRFNEVHLDVYDGNSVSFVQVLYEKLVNFDIDDPYLLHILALVPHLHPLEYQGLVKPLVSALNFVAKDSLGLISSRYADLDVYIQCYDHEVLPSCLDLCANSESTVRLLSLLLFSLCHLLYQDQDLINKKDQANEVENIVDPIDGVLSKEVYFMLTCFLKGAKNYELKLSCISTLMNFSTHSRLNEQSKHANIRKLLPSLIELIKLDDEDGSHEEVHYKKQPSWLRRRYNPFYLLSKLCLQFEFVNGFLFDCNLILKFCDIIDENFIKLKFDDADEYELNKLSDVFLILSSVTSKNEVNRKAVLDDDLVNMIERVLSFHVVNLKKFDQEAIGEEEMAVSNQLALSTCYLLRSLSRSVSNLRTYLSEMDVIANMLDILQFQISKRTDVSSSILKGENLLKTVVLSICANLVLDFSPMRKKLLSCEGDKFLKILGDLLNDSQGSDENNDVDNDSILINSLYVVRHIFYHEKDLDVLNKVVSMIGYDGLINLCKHRNVKVGEQALNVLRNLTCHDSQMKAVLEALNTDDAFFQFLQQELRDKILRKENNILECLVYIIVNVSAIDEERRDLIVQHPEILRAIYDILSTTKNESLTVACLWVVINLGWLDNVQQRSGESMNFFQSMGNSSNGDPAVGGRSRVLKEMGFTLLIRRVLDETESLDVKERGSIALTNLER
ncbi:glucose-induced degradation complex subunit VID28 CYBJADRAFT_174997 [Cyberlindnera jadinii NRRL Y-1542]|uniref:UNC-45/Cro1/She4 central domain-containing protein n=1 Tax=Cyberlindnera jadinii (strain ATCC 18201 / CBS 1600 / BCRC 20928 / JCM 3617 / NBRC 0987 / NRRL Y-1542) TaxID=983966 RepID=A0A1E4RW13_CYBJN|nr:hypothetical protein CYBJADRAFT_174997 [Cyberlindnera jadinii NRRL Y-1542]ODV71467.1 hypothetical protein CYBJADRAFT_174997 [Cyberlindnera jadinii NRRL Y-1542]